MGTEPSETLDGFRRILSLPRFYRFAQLAVGAERFRRTLVTEILQVREGERIIDIGCGTADILEHLDGVDYVGFDHSKAYIESAAERFSGKGRFVAGTAGSIELGSITQRSLAMSIGVLHHLDDNEAIAALRLAASLLDSNGRFISVDPTFAQGQHPIGRFLASRDRGRHVRTPEQTRTLVERVFDTCKVSVRHDLLHVPYSHVLVAAESE